MRSIKFVTLVLIATMIASPVFAESWLDAWARQAIVADPNVYEGNSRTYLSGGRLSMRFAQNGEVPPPLVSFSPPHLRTGCGGIDLFGGGLGFLNDPELLVDRYIGIAQGAVVSYGFSLALEMLCPSCEAIMQSLSNAATELNKLQLSDCEATRGVKMVLDDIRSGDMTETTKHIKAVGNNLSNAGSDLYYAFAQGQGSSDYEEAVDDLVSGCPTDYTAIFHTNGSLIHNILVFAGEDPQWTETLSAFFGDIRIQNGDEYQYYEPCLNDIDISRLIDDGMVIRQNWECQPTQITINNMQYDNLYDYIFSTSLELAERFLDPNNNVPLTDNQRILINSGNPSILDMLYLDMFEARADFSAQAFAEGYTHYYAYQYLYDITKKMSATVKSVFSTARAIRNRTSVDEECEISITANVLSYIELIEARVKNQHEIVKGEYLTSREEIIDRIINAEHLAQMKGRIKTHMVKNIDISQ